MSEADITFNHGHWRWKLKDFILKIGLLPVLIIVAVGFHIVSDGHFFTVSNIDIIFYQAAINLVLAAGMTFVILAGGIDLSVGSVLTFTAIFGLLVSNLPGLSYLWALASLSAGLCLGLINGLLVARLRLPPTLVTLGMISVVLGCARLLAKDMTIYTSNLPLSFLGAASFFGIPCQTIVAMIVLVASWFVLTRTVLGKYIYFVGGNRDAAHLAGIDVPRVQLIVYAISGLVAGIGAVLLVSKVHGANAIQIGHSSYMLDAIGGVIIGGISFGGGVGSIWGTFVGVLFMATLSNGLILIGVPDIWQYVAKGLLIIGSVMLDRVRLRASGRA
jgi:ribose transport system permease protein